MKRDQNMKTKPNLESSLIMETRLKHENETDDVIYNDVIDDITSDDVMVLGAGVMMSYCGDDDVMGNNSSHIYHSQYSIWISLLPPSEPTRKK